MKQRLGKKEMLQVWGPFSQWAYGADGASQLATETRKGDLGRIEMKPGQRLRSRSGVRAIKPRHLPEFLAAEIDLASKLEKEGVHGKNRSGKEPDTEVSGLISVIPLG
jgi:hypothetical protein